MQLIHNNAVMQLFERVESLAQEPHDSWRCIYLRLRNKQSPEKLEMYRDFIIKPIANLLTDYEGTIYLCNDAEIFILFQGDIQQVFSKLHMHFGDVDPYQEAGQSESSLFRVFEFNLGRNWAGFYALCESKYLSALADKELLRGDITVKIPHNLPVQLKRAAKRKKPFALSAMLRTQAQKLSVALARDA